MHVATKWMKPSEAGPARKAGCARESLRFRVSVVFCEAPKFKHQLTQKRYLVPKGTGIVMGSQRGGEVADFYHLENVIRVFRIQARG